MIRKVFAVGAVVLLGVIGYLTVAPVAAQGKGDGRVLSKVTFIHFRKAPAKPAGVGGGKKTDEGSYTYIAKGARWRTVEPFLLNPNCTDGIPGGTATITEAVGYGMTTWRGAGGNALSIFGGLDVDCTVVYNNGAFRGYNTISFGNYEGNANVIAVTTVWGYFGGRPEQREIIEAHILMNDAWFWGDADLTGTNDPPVMDLKNIFTHELGHVAGMGDLYLVGAGEETMYGYSTYEETKKRDLYTGDITGITNLYK